MTSGATPLTWPAGWRAPGSSERSRYVWHRLTEAASNILYGSLEGQIVKSHNSNRKINVHPSPVLRTSPEMNI